MAVEFIIHAPPTGKQRPRVTSHGTYTPKKTKDYEQLVRAEFQRQCRGVYFFDKPLRVWITAIYPVPKSVTKAKREKMLRGEVRPKVKPDYDNVEKAVCDALNGLAYKDDAQIVEAHFRKWYGDTPQVRVKIEVAE